MKKKIFNSLLSFAMLFSLTTNTSVFAEEEITSEEGTNENGGVQDTTLQSRIDALPTVDEFQSKTESEQDEIYNEAESITDALNNLSSKEQAELDTTKLEELFEYINSLVTVLDESTVTLDLANGKIVISPTGYTQNGISYDFVGTYTITGSLTGDTPLSFTNTTDSEVTYNVIFDNVHILGDTYCSAVTFAKETKSDIILNLTNNGKSEVRAYGGPSFQTFDESSANVSINLTDNGSLYLGPQDSSQSGYSEQRVYSTGIDFKKDGETVSNNEEYTSGSYQTDANVITPENNNGSITKGGTYYIEGGTYSINSYVAYIETNDNVTLVIEGDITANGDFLLIDTLLLFTEGEVVINNEANHKIEAKGTSQNTGYIVQNMQENNKKITINGGEYIGYQSDYGSNPVSSLIDCELNTNELVLNNCSFNFNDDRKPDIYATNVIVTNCVFKNCSDAIVATKSVTLDGTNTFTNTSNSDIKLASSDARLSFGENFVANGQIKVSLENDLTEGEKRQITNETDIKYLSALAAANSDYAIGYDQTNQYFYIWEHTHTWTYNLNSTKDTIEAHCLNEECIYHDNPLTATITVASIVYNGKQYDKASVTNNISSITGAEPYDITYEGIKELGTDYPANTVPPTNAGTYRAMFTVENAGKDVICYQNFAIAKANQSSPSGLVLSAETIKGKHDGSISNVSTSMEYRKKGEDTYTAITSTTLDGLAGGTYYVRYKATQNYNASSETECVIDITAQGLDVVVPSEQNGYKLMVDKALVEYDESSKITFTLNDGYSKTEDFKIKVNGTEITLDSRDEYTITNIHENQMITVEGVDDITAPTINGLENGKTYTKTQTFTVTEPNLKEVTVDGVVVQPKEGVYTLAPKTGTYTIVARDLSLNEMEITVTVNFEEIKQPTIASKTYTGKVMVADIESTENYEVTQNDGGTDVGKYDVKLTLKDTVNYKWKDSTEAIVTIPFEITKANPVVEVKANSLTANGQKQELVTGKTSGGTLKYYVDGEWTTTVPKAKDAGTYTVKYKVEGDKNYNDVKESSITVKIKSKYVPETNNQSSSTTYSLVPTGVDNNN